MEGFQKVQKKRGLGWCQILVGGLHLGSEFLKLEEVLSQGLSERVEGSFATGTEQGLSSEDFAAVVVAN